MVDKLYELCMPQWVALHAARHNGERCMSHGTMGSRCTLHDKKDKDGKMRAAGEIFMCQFTFSY